MDKDPIHHRPELARRLAAMLLGHDPLSAAGRSGLFLSAPCLTGKSTFLHNDLIPAVEDAGAVAIYVDLWMNGGSRIRGRANTSLPDESRWLNEG